LHTIIGTISASIAIFLVVISGIANVNNSNSKYFFIFLIVALSFNVFVVGINQIYDVKIDRVNKPHLPLAKGDFTSKAGWIITIWAVLLGLFIAASNVILLIGAVLISILGIAYSVPPLRLRNNFLLASLLILFGRGIILNLIAFYYFNSEINGSYAMRDEILYILVFISIFTIVISLFKDIPDTKGDSIFQIRTLATVVNTSFVYNFCISLLLLNYLIAISFQVFVLDLLHEEILIVYRVLVIVIFCLSLLFKDKIFNHLDTIKLYYKFIWILLYIEYIAIAFLTK
jgi:homogentisate phytyltransferase/homogentisate geranylgeranyltransferase